MALGSTWIFIDGPDIFAMGAGDVLKEQLAENAFTSQSFNLVMCSSIKGKVGWLGPSGVGCLGTITSSSSSSFMSSFSVRPYTRAAGRGQCSGTHPRFLRALRETSVVFTPLVK